MIHSYKILNVVSICDPAESQMLMIVTLTSSKENRCVTPQK